MDIKEEKGLTGIDISIAVIAIIISTTLILALMCHNGLENLKIAKETMGMIYITEVFENIGILDYDNITEENKDSFISKEIYDNYKVDITVNNNIDGKEQDIIKKINLTLTYKIGNKTYSCSAERLKSKE